MFQSADDGDFFTFFLFVFLCFVGLFGLGGFRWVGFLLLVGVGAEG
ncbi:MAG: hypothetical protein HOA16_06655 [Opitutae bacterium]|nr:hypothetical protein [Opitutae bacterium]